MGGVLGWVGCEVCVRKRGPFARVHVVCVVGECGVRATHAPSCTMYLAGRNKVAGVRGTIWWYRGTGWRVVRWWETGVVRGVLCLAGVGRRDGAGVGGGGGWVHGACAARAGGPWVGGWEMVWVGLCRWENT